MSGTIGSGGTTSLNRPLVSDAPRLTVQALPGFGKSVDLKWTGAASVPLTRVSRSHEGLVIGTGGTTVSVVMRYWAMPLGRGWRWRFECPKCGTSRDVLHWRGEWGCRGKECLNLEHACRHELRWCPAVRRRARLLRKLARYSPRGLKARLLRAQIARQEAVMLANMKRANRDLTRRVKRHGGRRRASSG
jgi:hypothetical protein